MPEEFEFLIKALFVVIGIGGALYSAYATIMAKISCGWVPVTGKITSHEMDESRDSDGDSMYKAKVEYAYEYRGRRYNGKRIAFGFSSWNIRSLVSKAYSEAISEYPAVKVYVNGNSPKISSILVGIRSFHIANILFFNFWNIIVYKALTSLSI
ncbi:DUF3592 domain-containing protein [Teredinibacter purpureus]|uniref:DUF3592 domain-containing protein n=1 Tax=Teredinibacter purpureus TaxID=2731756 RepID=UPI0005F7E7E7|nr:DUF3592 domain-containing protein [Teredinibacter purpureus]